MAGTSEGAKLIWGCPNCEKDLFQSMLAAAASIVKPGYSSPALMAQVHWGKVGGECLEEASVNLRNCSVSLLCTLFDGVTYFLC